MITASHRSRITISFALRINLTLLQRGLSALAKAGQNLITGFRGSNGSLTVCASENDTYRVLSALEVEPGSFLERQSL